MYHCMNIVTEEFGYGAAVLIRSVIPYKWDDLMIKNRKWEWKSISALVNWPAKVCLAYDISKKDNWVNMLLDNSIIFLEDVGYKLPKIQVSKRIGISKWMDKEWRFWF
jgi:3-methyladenine DNA glycosylase Mpg